MYANKRNEKATGGLTMTWVKVRDENGRTHLEARWASAHPASMLTKHAA